jgi:hypothetical protein
MNEYHGYKVSVYDASNEQFDTLHLGSANNAEAEAHRVASTLQSLHYWQGRKVTHTDVVFCNGKHWRIEKEYAV